MNIKKIETVIKNNEAPEVMIMATVKLGIGEANHVWQGTMEDGTAKLSAYKLTGVMYFSGERYLPSEVAMYSLRQAYKKVIQPRVEDLGEE